MTTLGKNVKITAPRSSRIAARALFAKLDAKLMTPMENLDVFAYDGGSIGFEYIADADALTPVQMRIAPWLEIAVDNVDARREQLLALGLEQLDYRDKERHYFVGPAGVVFRLAPRS
jgi:hypothetical protein